MKDFGFPLRAHLVCRSDLDEKVFILEQFSPHREFDIDSKIFLDSKTFVPSYLTIVFTRLSNNRFNRFFSHAGCTIQSEFSTEEFVFPTQHELRFFLIRYPLVFTFSKITATTMLRLLSSLVVLFGGADGLEFKFDKVQNQESKRKQKPDLGEMWDSVTDKVENAVDQVKSGVQAVVSDVKDAGADIKDAWEAGENAVHNIVHGIHKTPEETIQFNNLKKAGCGV